jgi:gentisate 1,2-dioxygenase
VVEGSGYTVIDGQRLDWEEKDVFSVPAWAFHEHANSSDRPAIVFSVTDIPVKRALGYYRSRRIRAGGSNFPLISWKRGRTSLSMP